MCKIVVYSKKYGIHKNQWWKKNLTQQLYYFDNIIIIQIKWNVTYRLEQIWWTPLPKVVKNLNPKSIQICIFYFWRCYSYEILHSVDFVRLISKSNILKSIDRQILHVETKDDYIFINFNMFAIKNRGPGPTIWI